MKAPGKQIKLLMQCLSLLKEININDHNHDVCQLITSKKKYQEHQNETEYGTYTIGRLLINEILERLHKKLEKTGAFFDIGGQYMDSLDHILLVRENIDEL